MNDMEWVDVQNLKDEVERLRADMEAVRRYLRSEAEFGLDTPEGQRWYRLTMASRLPDSVVRWVLAS